MARYQPAVFVFVLTGCGACEEFLPRFQRVCTPFRRYLPIGVYDIARDKRAMAFSDKLGVRATPTMVTLSPSGQLRRTVGAVDDATIARTIDGVLRSR